MSMLTITPTPAKRRTPKPKWMVDDSVTVDGTRWIIRDIYRPAGHVGHVELVAASTVNHGIRWTTTLDKLPEKRA